MKTLLNWCILLISVAGFSDSNYSLKATGIDYGGGISEKSTYHAQLNVKDIHGISTSNSYSAAYGFIPQSRNVNLKTGKLTIDVSPAEGGTTDPTGIVEFLSGQSFDIKATHNASYIFTKWTGTGEVTIASPTAAETTITVYGTAAVTANFVKASISLTSPVGGESWTIGTQNKITWTSENVPGKVVISLLKSNTLYTKITGGIENTGGYDWEIPAYVAAGTDYKIQIAAVGRGDINGSSASNFALVSSTPSILDMTSPDGNETWTIGSTKTITWNTDIKSGYLAIKLFKNGQFYQYISKSAINNGQYEWIIPNSLSSDNTYQIKLELLGSSLSSISAGFFTLSTTTAADGKISLTAPVGNETWTTGSTQQITWTSSGDVKPSFVKIELLNNSKTELVIAASNSNSGSYSWTIPTTLSNDTDYRLKVSGIDADVVGYSPDYFTISSLASATLTVAASPSSGAVVSPSGSVTIGTGIQQAIAVTPSANYSFVRWISDANAHINNPFSSTTYCTISDSATVVAVMAEKEDMKSLTIKMRTDTVSKDSIDVKNAIIPSGKISGFDVSTDTVTFVIDGLEFALTRDNGEYSQSGQKEIYTYKTAKDILPKVNFKLDLVKNIWTLKISKITSLAPYLDSADGISISLMIVPGSSETPSFSCGYQLAVDETTSWKFDSKKNNYSDPIGTSFKITNQNGKQNTNKVNSDSFKISKAELSNAISFDPEYDAVTLLIDDSWMETMTGFTQSGTKETFKWKGSLSTETGTLSFNLNIEKGQWNFTLSKSNLTELSGFDGFNVKLFVSDFYGEQTIYPAETITLKYKQ